MTEPRIEILAVSGFQRCGSSMTMRMLEAGGFPVLEGATRGAYEHPDLLPHRIEDVAVLAPGKAVKILEPLYYSDGFPPAEWAWIWLDRDPWQMAKSAMTFMRTLTGMKFEPNARHTLAVSYRQDRDRAVASLPGRVLELSFEDILRSPYSAARTISDFVEEGGFTGFDSYRAAEVIVERGAEASGSLEWEMSQ